MKLKLFASTLALTTAFSLSASAAALLAWDVNGESSPEFLTASTIASNIDQSSGRNTLSRTGVDQNAGANSYNSKGWNTTNTFDKDNYYISFIVAPESGYEITYESLSFVMWGSNTAPDTGRWGYSIDGGDNFVLQDPMAMPNSSSPSETWDFADFTTDQSVEFRYWSYGATSINGGTAGSGGTMRIGNRGGDDLVLNGSTALIPEPSTTLLFGFFGLLFLRRQR